MCSSLFHFFGERKIEFGPLRVILRVDRTAMSSEYGFADGKADAHSLMSVGVFKQVDDHLFERKGVKILLRTDRGKIYLVFMPVLIYNINITKKYKFEGKDG